MANKHGGSRPGAGRPPKKLRSVNAEAQGGIQVGALAFLMNCVNDAGLDASLRIKAAGLLLAAGRRGTAVMREEALAEKLAGYAIDQPWQDRLMEELEGELENEITAH